MMNTDKQSPTLHFLITGGTGLIGRHLCTHLLTQGHRVTILTRHINESASLFKDRVMLIHSLTQINDNEQIDIIINLAGEPISQRWNQTVKQKILNSRIGVTQNIVALMARLNTKPAYFLSGSAVGIYGSSLSRVCTEDVNISSANMSNSFSEQLCLSWEAEAVKAAELYGIKTGLLRTGIVLSTQGGALKAMLLPFRFGLGGKTGQGSQWFSWIHIEDIIQLMLLMIRKQIVGVVNGTAPHPVTNQQFALALGHVLKRPVFLTIPAWLVKLLFADMGRELLLQGQRVIPQRALALGYQFQYDYVEEALSDVIAYEK